ncbi:LPXTG cell wall anchor domain-containing protein [Plantibacter sp. YIM 135249]|uniref:LPXTG cell wall anchor domain-containing protein n=1 Tax=Plantibacter sp. YIM 135249 TaxID=3423918 RepID=UPI003D33B373
MTQRRTGGIVAAGMLAAGSVLAFAGPATAATGDVLCEVADGDNYLSRVTDLGAGTFRVDLVDTTLATAESADGESYLVLPTEPVDLRFGTSVTALGPQFELVGAPTPSQGIVTTFPATGSLPFDVELVGAAGGTGETVTVGASPEGAQLTWLSDHDALEIPGSPRIVPTQFEFPFDAIDASASVLSFTLHVSDAAPRGIDLPAVLGSEVTFNGASLNPVTGEVSPAGDTGSFSVGACVIPASAIPPLVPPTTEPTGQPTAAPIVASPSAARLPDTGSAAGLVAPVGAVLLLLGAAGLLLRRRLQSSARPVLRPRSRPSN